MHHEAAIAADPRVCALDDPPPSDEFEAGLVVGALDDLQPHGLIGEFHSELLPRVGAVGKNVRDEGEQPPRPSDESGGTVAILHARWDHTDAEQKPDRINDQIALNALDLLSRVISDRIGITPPFSVALTLCVSIMAAVGEASRPSASRHFVSSM